MARAGRRSPSAKDAFSGPHAAKIAGTTYRRLDYWTRKGLIRPSVQTSDGSGSYRLYSPLDILAMKVAQRMREEGVGLGTIEKALVSVTKGGQLGVAASRFIVQRGRLIVQDSGGNVDVSARGRLFLSVALDVLGVSQVSGEGTRAHRRLVTAARKPPAKASGRAKAAMLLASASSL
jgi:DNA-binding transcriptional MerR regulator